MDSSEFEDCTIPERKDRSDGKTALLCRNVKNQTWVFMNEMRRTKTKERYVITIWQWMKPNPKESRIELVRVSHSWNYEDSNSPKEKHQDIVFVQDPKNHGPKSTQPFHINLDHSSRKFLGKDSSCKACKKYFDIDYFELAFDNKPEYGEYKILNLDATVENVFSELKKKGFDTTYPHKVKLGQSYQLLI